MVLYVQFQYIRMTGIGASQKEKDKATPLPHLRLWLINLIFNIIILIGLKLWKYFNPNKIQIVTIENCIVTIENCYNLLSIYLF